MTLSGTCVMSVRAISGETGGFLLSCDHRFALGVGLFPYFVTLIVDELIARVQEEVPRCMLFADDIVSVNESRDGVNAELGRHQEALESKGFKISHTKTIYELQLLAKCAKS